jgi:hypothetical protein
MAAPSGVSNGEEAPKSRTKPAFLDVLCHVKVAPTFTQNGALALAPGMLGVTEAASLVRFIRDARIRRGAAPGASVAQTPRVVFGAHVLITGDAAGLLGRQVTGGESQ